MATFNLTTGINVFSGVGNDADTFSGPGGGNDQLDGAGGNDSFIIDSSQIGTIQGGSGNDTLTISDGQLNLGLAISGVEVLIADSSNLYASVAQLASFSSLTSSMSTSDFYYFLQGAGGTLDFSTRYDNSAILHVEAGMATSAVTLTGTSGSDYFSSGEYADTLNGGGGSDTLFGDAGADKIDGGTGIDTLQGGMGNDTYYVDNAADFVDENYFGGGTDTVLTTVSYALAANQSVETLQLAASTVAQPLNLTGNNIGNVLIGNAGANILNGGGGADLMQGGSGNDSYVVDNVGDVVKENGGANSGVDTVVSSVSYALTAGQYVEVLQFSSTVGAAALNLTGNELANSLIGNAGANALQGLAGADVLQGGGARDILVPGNDTAVDTIRFNAISDSTGGNRDQLLSADFNNEDKLDFQIRPTVFAGTVLTGNLNNGANFNNEIATAVNGLLGAGGAIEAVLFDPNGGGLNQAGHTYLVVDANNDGSYTANADYLVELVNFTGTLDATDFI